MVNNKNIEFDDIISIRSDLAELNTVREFVAMKAKEFGFSDKEAYNISLAVDEACSNLIKHAYNLDFKRTINIKVEKKGKQFIVNISDNGTPFNPLEFPMKNMKDYFKEFKCGGLGIQIMRSVMDEIVYFPSNISNPYNTLKLKKELSL